MRTVTDTLKYLKKKFLAYFLGEFQTLLQQD